MVKVYKHRSNELYPILQCSSIISYLIIFTFITPGKTLASWVLALEQESYLSYKKICDKEDNANYRPISLIFRYNNISISKY